MIPVLPEMFYTSHESTFLWLSRHQTPLAATSRPGRGLRGIVEVQMATTTTVTVDKNALTILHPGNSHGTQRWRFEDDFPNDYMEMCTFLSRSCTVYYHILSLNKSTRIDYKGSGAVLATGDCVFFKELHGVLWARLIQDLIQLLTQT